MPFKGPHDAAKPCLGITERILQLYREGQQRRHQLCPHGTTGFNPASIPGLTAVLREYQFDAVCWMVEREGCPGSQDDGCGELHPLWVELPSFPKASSPDTSSFSHPGHIYFSPYMGRWVGVGNGVFRKGARDRESVQSLRFT